MTYQAGDIYLVDSDHLGAKFVKFLMIAPTLWQYLWRCLPWFKQNKVIYYHAGICIGDNKVIEQQGKCEYEDVYDAITKKKAYIVFRKKDLTKEQKELLVTRAKSRLGETYDILLILGKTLTWLTGIKWFARHIQSKNKEFCVTLVSWIYLPIETFGKATHHEVTTDNIEDFCREHPDKWEIIDKK